MGAGQQAMQAGQYPMDQAAMEGAQYPMQQQGMSMGQYPYDPYTAAQMQVSQQAMQQSYEQQQTFVAQGYGQQPITQMAQPAQYQVPVAGYGGASMQQAMQAQMAADPFGSAAGMQQQVAGSLDPFYQPLTSNLRGRPLGEGVESVRGRPLGEAVESPPDSPRGQPIGEGRHTGTLPTGFKS